MTRHAFLAAAAAFGLMTATAATASPCASEIDTLSKTISEEGRQAISASTAGQAEAGKRGGQGVTGSAAGQTPAPPEKSAEAGKGAEQVQAAKVALDEARTLDGKGDAKGCGDAVQRAKNALAAAP